MQSLLSFVLPATFFTLVQFVSLPFQSADAKIGTQHGKCNLFVCFFLLQVKFKIGTNLSFFKLMFLFVCFVLHYWESLNTKWILHQNIINEKIACGDTGSSFDCKITHQAWFTLLQTHVMLLSIKIEVWTCAFSISLPFSVFNDASVLNCWWAKQAWHVGMVMDRFNEGPYFPLKTWSAISANIYTFCEAFVMVKLNGP